VNKNRVWFCILLMAMLGVFLIPGCAQSTSDHSSSANKRSSIKRQGS